MEGSDRQQARRVGAVQVLKCIPASQREGLRNGIKWRDDHLGIKRYNLKTCFWKNVYFGPLKANSINNPCLPQMNSSHQPVPAWPSRDPRRQ